MMNTMKRTAAVMMVLCMAMATPLGAFADNGAATADTVKPARAEKLMAKGEALRENAGQGKKARQERVLALFDQYAPELASEEAALMAEHNAVHVELEAVHSSLKDIREGNREEVKAYMAPIREEIRQQVKAGEMTPEEAKEAIQEALLAQFGSDDVKALREELQTVRDAIKAQAEVRKGILETLKTAVKAQDEAGANAALTDLYHLHAEHVALDQEKLGILQDILAALQ